VLLAGEKNIKYNIEIEKLTRRLTKKEKFGRACNACGWMGMKKRKMFRRG